MFKIFEAVENNTFCHFQVVYSSFSSSEKAEFAVFQPLIQVCLIRGKAFPNKLSIKVSFETSGLMCELYRASLDSCVEASHLARHVDSLLELPRPQILPTGEGCVKRTEANECFIVSHSLMS